MLPLVAPDDKDLRFISSILGAVVSISLEDVIALEELDAKTRAILPALYGESYEDVQPVSMGSAALKYGPDGRVAWDEIWATFCDLALAGGPPHRGTLLEPASVSEIAANPEKHAEVVNEIVRGVSLVTGLPVRASAQPGWIEVQCDTIAMAEWLVRAIVIENVLASHQADILFLPAGPEFRLVKEIKNVVTVSAKTCHYWLEHTPQDQQQAIAAMFARMNSETPLLSPASPAEVLAAPGDYRSTVDKLAADLRPLGLPTFANRYGGWLGIECASVGQAVWLARGLIVDNVLARREGEVLFIPVHPVFATGGQCERLVSLFVRLYRLSLLKNG